MKVKTKRRICVCVAAAGLLFAFGSAGALELGSIELRQGAIQMIVGILLGAGGLYKSGYLK